MSHQAAESSDRGTKRSASRALGDNRQNAPKRRVQAEFLAPEDVRLRVAEAGLDLRIERTDLQDEEDDTTSSWIATTQNRGVLGHGSTDLIRRQLDQIDALAPDTMLEFIIHPIHQRVIPTQPSDNDSEREISPVPPGRSQQRKPDPLASARNPAKALPPRTRAQTRPRSEKSSSSPSNPVPAPPASYPRQSTNRGMTTFSQWLRNRRQSDSSRAAGDVSQEAASQGDKHEQDDTPRAKANKTPRSGSRRISYNTDNFFAKAMAAAKELGELDDDASDLPEDLDGRLLEGVNEDPDDADYTAGEGRSHVWDRSRETWTLRQERKPRRRDKFGRYLPGRGEDG